MEQGLLWVAVFVLLISNLCLALKIRRVEKKTKIAYPLATEKGNRIFEVMVQQQIGEGRRLADIIDMRLLQEDRQAALRSEQERHEAELRRLRQRPIDDDPQGASIVS